MELKQYLHITHSVTDQNYFDLVFIQGVKKKKKSGINIFLFKLHLLYILKEMY